jgi:ComF family protein
MKLLTPIQSVERCPFCFSSNFTPIQEACCEQCRTDPLPLKRIAAVFDYEGPAASLVRNLKYGGQPYIAKGCGAYLAYQFVNLGWPIPDTIIPMPMPRLRKLDRGYNQSALLAEALGEFLDRPVLDILHRRSTGFSQAGLNIAQRKALNSSAFTIKKNHPRLHDKTVLLIDDVMTTGSSLRCCAETLAGLYPADIYGLTLCRTI